MQRPLSSRVLFFLYKRYEFSTLKRCAPLSGPRRYVHFGVCAAQSASFALATTRPPDGLFYASCPYRRFPSALCLREPTASAPRGATPLSIVNYSLLIINSQSGFFFITPYCLGYCFGVGAVFSKTKSARFSPLARVRLFVSVCFAHSTF